jgi:hypothetical protein
MNCGMSGHLIMEAQWKLNGCVGGTRQLVPSKGEFQRFVMGA